MFPDGGCQPRNRESPDFSTEVLRVEIAETHLANVGRRSQPEAGGFCDSISLHVTFGYALE